MPGADLKTGCAVAERIRREVEPFSVGSIDRAPGRGLRRRRRRQSRRNAVLSQRSVPRTHGGPDLQFDLNTGAEPIDDPDQTIHSETCQVGIADTREVCSRDPGPSVCSPHRQFVAVQRFDDLGRQQRLELLHVGADQTEVAVNIAAAANQLQRVVLNRSISFNRFTRAVTRSISRFGVLIPWVDFF
jgi:hypothetical protein